MADSTRRPALTIAQLERVNAISSRKQRYVADQLDKALLLATDADSVKRKAAHECCGCWYSGPRISGQAFTDWKCDLCGEPQQMHHNTDTPRVCEVCAEAYGVCVSCGGDIDMRNRGRLTGRKAKRAALSAREQKTAGSSGGDP